MRRKKIGLALSGGGARGFSHVGVLQVLVENKIPVDIVAGTSAGSIAGGAFASGMSVDQIVAFANDVGYTNMMRPALGFGGLMSNAPMGTFIRKRFPAKRFEEMPTPFAAVAFDLGNSEKVILKEKGDLVTAIRASCAVPGIFAPVRDEKGRMLVDGGVLSPMPADITRSMGADVVIAVDLIGCGATYRTSSLTSIGIIIQSALASLRLSALNEGTHADIVIQPQIAHLRPDQIGKRDEFIELGRQAALQHIETIKKVIAA
ncbi:MAG: patatin-like phospholipase family protein [Acidobacteria bacterium]|nr:patatin-like phospholipase family protein [Acidobacteriota bacterium]